MSLLSQTARFLLLTALAIALVGSVGFYVLIHRTIQHEVDEILMSQVEQVEQRLKLLPANTPLRTDWDNNPQVIRIATGSINRPEFSDVSLPDPAHKEKSITFRQVKTNVAANRQTYQVTVQQAYYEFDELARIMSVGVIWGFLILMALSVVVGLGLAGRLWRPFHETIHQLGQFRLDQAANPMFPVSRIREFDLLNRSLQELTQKLWQQFSLQKQFTENASHELQTPLAIAAAELDFLMQSDHLRENDYAHLQRATDSLSRLSQLNRSLLLLTQVENDQFINEDVVNLSELLEQTIQDYEPFFAHRNLATEQSITANVRIRMNSQLASILVTNLLKNAVRHGCPRPDDMLGMIRMSLTTNSLIIQNTGKPLPFPDSQLFNRFVKNPAHPDSTGLGLALVKQICDRYRMSISYAYDTQQAMHSFQLTFP
ncbi:HAMP domain-containing sensor histidine kinase [Spirosoma flavus]